MSAPSSFEVSGPAVEYTDACGVGVYVEGRRQLSSTSFLPSSPFRCSCTREADMAPLRRATPAYWHPAQARRAAYPETHIEYRYTVNTSIHRTHRPPTPARTRSDVSSSIRRPSPPRARVMSCTPHPDSQPVARYPRPPRPPALPRIFTARTNDTYRRNRAPLALGATASCVPSWLHASPAPSTHRTHSHSTHWFAGPFLRSVQRMARCEQTSSPPTVASFHVPSFRSCYRNRCSAGPWFNSQCTALNRPAPVL